MGSLFTNYCCSEGEVMRFKLNFLVGLTKMC